MENKLTPKQKIFCEEYVLDWNATRAAKVAGYSEKTAQVIGHENLTKPIIKEYIDNIQKDIEKLAGISKLGLVNKLKEIVSKDEEQTKDKIKSIEVISKMIGYDAPTKVNQTIKDITLTEEERTTRIAELLKKAKK